ncbi:MAG: chorismate mutase [Holophaga sp.]|nr:chorismate mutase [Holophaga sp.]
MASSNSDPVIQRHRAQIAEIDGEILSALNRRIKLVKHLKDYKEAQGFPFFDAAQEDVVIANLCQANGGPLSNEGIHEIFGVILERLKSEAAGLGEDKSE